MSYESSIVLSVYLDVCPLSLLGSTTAVQAGRKLRLNFELQPQPRTDAAQPDEAANAVAVVPPAGANPSTDSAGAGNPPMRSHSPSQLREGFIARRSAG